MQGSHDVILRHLRDNPWTQLVEKFNKHQTNTEKPTRPDVYFTEDEFNKYSVQPSWKELLLQKEHELSVSREDTAPTRAPVSREDTALTRPPIVVVKKDPASTKPPPVTARNNVVQQPGKGRAWTDQLVAPPVATSQQHKPKMQGRLVYPRPSWLTMAEQRQYLELYDKYMKYIPAKASGVEVKEIHQLKELQLRVAAEQNEFMMFLETSARSFPEDYAFIHCESSKYIEEHLSWKRTRVTNYPRYYTILDTVSLAPPRSVTEHVNFCHVKTLLRLGTVPKVILPQIRADNRPHVPLNYARINCNFPATPAKDKNKKVCSGDETAEKLAQKYKVDVVISASGLKCLMDNSAPVYQQAWELPIVVREYAVEGGGSHRIVYIDQPFVPKVISAREKNTHYYKAALKTFLQHPRHGNPAKSCTTDGAGLSLADGGENAGVFGTANTCLEDLETFGVGVSALRRKFGRRCQTGDAELNEQKVKVRPDEVTSQSASVGSLKVEPLDDDRNVKMNETIDVRENETNEADSRMLEVDKESPDSPVTDSSATKMTLAATADMTTGVSIVDRRDNINEGVLNSSDCDSDDALVIDVSANFESEDGDGTGFNSSCVTGSGVSGQTREGSASDGNVEMMHGFSELKNGTEGNSESAMEVVSSEMKVMEIETKVEVNESDKKDENPVCSEVKDDVDELKEGVELDEIVDAGIMTRSLRRAMVQTLTRSDDNVSDTTSDMSNTRRRSLRCKARASDDVTSLNVETPKVASPMRRSLRSAVKGSSVDESDTGKKAAGNQRGRRSDTTSSKKECEKDESGSLEPHSGAKRGKTQRRVSDIPTDVGTGHTALPKQVSACEDGGASCQKRRSIRLIARTLNVIDDADVSSARSVTTGARKRRSEHLDTSRSVEVTSEISGPETPVLKVELPNKAHASENSTTCDGTGFLNVKGESSLVTSSGENDVVMAKSKKSGTSSAAQTDDSGSCVARSAHSDNDTDVIDVSKNDDSSIAVSGSHSAVIADDKSMTDQSAGNDSMTSLLTCDSTHLSEVSRAVHTESTRRYSRSIDSDIGGTQNTAVESIIHGPSTGDISTEIGREIGDSKGDATCVDNRSTGSMRSRNQAQKRMGPTAVNIASCSQGQMTDSVETPLDKILLAQQKLLEPRYPSRQQSSTVLSSDNTVTLHATLPSGDQTVNKLSSEQAAASEWEMCEDPASYSDEAPSRSDLSYDLWNLGDTRVLVRSRCHGNITPYRKQTYHVEMAPKLEYQPIFGMEQVTPSEAARNWTSLRLHNNCRLVRVRINSYTSEIMLVENVDLAQVTPPRSAFQPPSALTVLHRIMTKLLSLSAGQYLLSHTPSSGHANLKKSTLNHIGTYDLHLAHAGSPATSGNDPLSWIPIDTSLKLPFHKICFRIPATFEPKDAAGSKFQPNVQQKQKKKKKKAGKKK